MDKYIIGKLPNELEYIILDIPNSYSISVCVSIKVGSNDEEPRVNGISHLLEHMIYKSNKKFKTKYDLYRELDSIGASYNAYTDKNITTFFVKSHHKYQEKLIDIFSSLLCEPDVKSEELDNERNVVIEEISNSRDEPFDCIYNRFFSLIYGDKTAIAQKISGSVENIENISVDDVKNHLQRFYTAKNMVVSIAGRVHNGIEEYLKRSNFVKAPQSIYNYSNKKLLKHIKSTTIDFVHKPIKQVFLGIGFPTDGLLDEDRYIVKLIELILNGSMSSRLFVKLREEEGLVYSISTSSSNYEEGGVFFCITSFEKEKYVNVLDSLFSEFKRIQNELLDESELNRWKNFVSSQMVLDMENGMDIADYYARQLLFYPKNIIDFEKMLAIFEKITANDIQRVAQKIFNWKYMKIVILGDYSIHGKEMANNVLAVVKKNYS